MKEIIEINTSKLIDLNSLSLKERSKLRSTFFKDGYYICSVCKAEVQIQEDTPWDTENQEPSLHAQHKPEDAFFHTLIGMSEQKREAIFNNLPGVEGDKMRERYRLFKN